MKLDADAKHIATIAAILYAGDHDGEYQVPEDAVCAAMKVHQMSRAAVKKRYDEQDSEHL